MRVTPNSKADKPVALISGSNWNYLAACVFLVLNLILQSPEFVWCKHLPPNHVPIQSRKFCRLCSHLPIHCGRPSHDEQPEIQSNMNPFQLR